MALSDAFCHVNTACPSPGAANNPVGADGCACAIHPKLSASATLRFFSFIVALLETNRLLGHGNAVNVAKKRVRLQPPSLLEMRETFTNAPNFRSNLQRVF